MRVWVLQTKVEELGGSDPERCDTLVFSTIENVYQYLKDEMSLPKNKRDFLSEMKGKTIDLFKWVTDEGAKHVKFVRRLYVLQRHDVDAYYDELQNRMMKAKAPPKPRPEPATQFTGEIDEVDTW